MKQELINDKRLTSTMRRVRSGSTQLFREKSKSNGGFISLENADVILEHENKEMFANLINEKWFWVSGCSECNGKERGGSYIECKKHNVCLCCQIPRSKIAGTVWGGSKGWTCDTCKEAKDLDVRRKAFNKLGGEEPETDYMNEVICPHCGSKSDSGEVYQDENIECGVCEGNFEVEVHHSVCYSTVVIGERITA